MKALQKGAANISMNRRGTMDLSAKQKRVMMIVLAIVLVLSMFFTHAATSDANTIISPNAVEVYLSSDHDDGDNSWYNAPKSLQYTLDQQASLDLTEAGSTSGTVIHVDPNTQHQEILGIGSSFEESTIYNLSKMSPWTREQALRDLVDPDEGIGMDFMRVTIGTSDFTAQPFYSYSESYDPSLSNFSIQKDFDHNIIQTVQQALAINPDLKIFASPWSPPGWMKTTGSMVRGELYNQYVPVLAQYYRMFIQAYEAEGIPIHAMTLQNEPLLEIDYPSMYMPPHQQLELAIALRAELDAHNLNTELWIYDHNPYAAWDYVWPILDDAQGYDVVDGIAFHDYSGSMNIMGDINDFYTDHTVHMTERSVWGTSGADRIAQYFRNGASSYNAWVSMLDSNISTHQWVGTPDPTLLIQNANNVNDYWKIPIYYMTGNYSKFIDRGAHRIESNYGSANSVTNVSFLNPDNTIVTVVINQTSSPQTFTIQSEGTQFVATIPAETVGTYKWERTQGDGGSTSWIPGTVQAQDWSLMSGVQLEPTTDVGGGYNVGWIDTGDWMEYDVTVSESGIYNVEYRVASPNNGGQFILNFDHFTFDTVNIPNTGGWQNWETVTSTVELDAGTQTMSVYATSGGWNINWISFEKESSGENVVQNSTFETGDFSDWDQWNGGTLAQLIDTDFTYLGNFKLTHWADTAYQQLTYQTISVPNGTYDFSAWARSGGGQNKLHFFVADYGGSERQAPISDYHPQEWIQYTLDHIQVTNGQITIGVWSDANANNWAAFDHFEVIRR